MLFILLFAWFVVFPNELPRLQSCFFRKLKQGKKPHHFNDLADTLSVDDFELEIKKEFLNEALMNLEEVESAFMELESSSEPTPLLDRIFRLAHNLKGGSRAVGFGEVAEFTHQLESLVLKIQKNEISLCPEIVTTLLQSNDRLVEMMSSLKDNMSATFNNTDLLQNIQEWLEGKKTSTSALASQPQTNPTPISSSNAPAELEPEATAEVQSPDVAAIDSPDTLLPESTAAMPPAANSFFTDETAVAPQLSLVEDTAETPQGAMARELSSPSEKDPASQQNNNNPAAANKEKKQTKEDELVRVSLAKVDLLNDFVGELIVLQSVIQQQAAQPGAQLMPTLRQMLKLSKDIQSLSMSLRMLPVKPLVQKLQRVVRDTAQALTKDVQFEVVGEQMEIDKSVLDRLGDPLIHIVRNAVDHGLETPDKREAAQKSRKGQIVLSFATEGNHLVIEVRDDGAGIHTSVLRKKAIEKKLIADNQTLTEKQLIHLIFHPGFSTKAVTSEISGRGVGMDVVKTNVEKIGGTVDVTTQPGSGSCFRLQIPLSLAVIEGLVVASDNHRYVIPLNQVVETVNLKSNKTYLDKVGVGSCLELRGKIVPMFYIDEVLGMKKGKSRTDGTGLIVNVNDRPMALIVNDILRAQQIVIKPFSNGIKAQEGWIGTCILGDGLPTLILNPVDLLSGRIIESTNQDLGGAA